jgi:hypothetical protein
MLIFPAVGPAKALATVTVSACGEPLMMSMSAVPIPPSKERPAAGMGSPLK